MRQSVFPTALDILAVRLLLTLTPILLTAIPVFAQEDSPIPPYAPGSEALCEQVAIDGAQATDNPGLEADVSSGSVDVFFGEMPAGVNSFSFENGDLFVILVPVSTNVFEIFAGIAHEWWHKNNPTGNPPLEPKARLQWDACQEAGALTYSLQQLKKLADTNQKPPCALVDKINKDLGWEALCCALGPDAQGPPDPNPSGLEIDCE